MDYSATDNVFYGFDQNGKGLKFQNFIKETKLVNIRGYNAHKFHKIIMPPLLAALQNKALPLNVRLIVLKNHLGPNSIAFKALVTNYAAEQAKESNQEKQFKMLMTQLRSLNQTYCNESSTSCLGRRPQECIRLCGRSFDPRREDQGKE